MRFLARSDNEGRAEGLLDAGGTRHGSIIYSGCAARLFGIRYLTRLTLAMALPLRPINYQYAGLHARPPTPVHPGRVASKGHLEDKVSQLPGLERARNVTHYTQRRAQ